MASGEEEDYYLGKLRNLLRESESIIFLFLPSPTNEMGYPMNSEDHPLKTLLYFFTDGK